MNTPEPMWPLSWPIGWPRIPSYKRSAPKFRGRDKRLIAIGEASTRIEYELGRLGVKDDDIIISTNVKPKLTGGQGSNVNDPGVAVYWTEKGGARRCIAIDQYHTVAGNLAAVAATLEYMRGIQRHGGATVQDRAFTGFTALPAPDASQPSPHTVLGVAPGATRAEIDKAYRDRAAKAHPDRPGGSHAAMSQLNQARDAMLNSARA